MNRALDKNKVGEIEKLNGFKTLHGSKLSAYPDLMDILNGYYDQAKVDIDNASSLSELSSIPSGFDSRAKDLEDRIPKKKTPTTPGEPSKPKPEPRNSISLYSLLTKTDVNCENDVEEILNTIKGKLNEKLKSGPFDIKW